MKMIMNKYRVSGHVVSLVQCRKVIQDFKLDKYICPIQYYTKDFLQNSSKYHTSTQVKGRGMQFRRQL